MTYFHVLWTRPQLTPDVAPDAQDLVLWDFEFLTWLLSALEARRYGPLRLVTDARGALAVQRVGLEWVYNGGISTTLDAVPREVDPSIFWAAGKLYAYRSVNPPCVCVDMDAVLWKPVAPAAPVMALHPEGKDWGWYRDDRQHFAPFGFDGPDWDWNLDPFNTGVVYLGDAAAMRLYVDTATAFVERFSREVCADPAQRPAFTNAMIFAEQRLLPMCCQRLGLTVAPLTRTIPGAAGLPQNPDCLHLWRAKLAYKLCPDARLTLLNWLIKRLLHTFPEARPLLARWDLDRAKVRSEGGVVNPADLAQANLGDLRFSLLRNVQGGIKVTDLISGAERDAAEGSMVWSGEIIRPEPGARFELEVIGLKSLKFQTAA